MVVRADPGLISEPDRGALRPGLRPDGRVFLVLPPPDRLAMGAYDYLKETGRRIPRDVAVAGFDNQWLIATQIRPALTTVAVPHYEMGKRSVQLALGYLDESGPQQTALPCQLITRKSS